MRRILLALLLVALVAPCAHSGVSSFPGGGVPVEGGGAPEGFELDAVAYNSGGASATSTASHALGAASGSNRVVVAIVLVDNYSVLEHASMTYNGAAMTACGGYIHSPSNHYLVAKGFYLLDAGLPASAGSYNVVSTLESAPTQAHVVSVFSFVGALQSAPADITGASAVNLESVSVSVTPSAEGDISVEATMHEAGAITAAAANGQTVDWLAYSAATSMGGGHKSLSAGANTLGWTFTGGTSGRSIAVATYVRPAE